MHEAPESSRRHGSSAPGRLALAPALLVAAGAAGAMAASESGPLPRGTTVERQLFLMGTRATLAVTAGDRATALAATEVAVRALESSEARLSTWRGDSELSRLNQAPVATPVPL